MSVKEYRIAGFPLCKGVVSGVPPCKGVPAEVARCKDVIVSSDALVGGRDDIKASGRMKRLTIDIPESLHRQIKASCAQRGAKIADELRAILAEKYGKV
ncbi:hypothetical protein MOQ14_16975 [Stenotrophomonas maltophilia]|uniref:plasmid partition protein ParG n=1 Tax=Stenotrophomonas maltophilia TaxID=40324 RepID=UPI001F534D4B|nr:plasmid partition protein ParG [Stenotrophomonas maltophilia]MCI1140275.1 hypothetical protein [Stenotrophomonas maltophilia]